MTPECTQTATQLLIANLPATLVALGALVAAIRGAQWVQRTVENGGKVAVEKRPARRKSSRKPRGAKL